MNRQSETERVYVPIITKSWLLIRVPSDLYLTVTFGGDVT